MMFDECYSVGLMNAANTRSKLKNALSEGVVNSYVEEDAITMVRFYVNSPEPFNLLTYGEKNDGA